MFIVVSRGFYSCLLALRKTLFGNYKLITVTPHNMLPSLVLSNALELRHGRACGTRLFAPPFFPVGRPPKPVRHDVPGSPAVVGLADAHHLQWPVIVCQTVHGPFWTLQHRASGCSNDCNRARVLTGVCGAIARMPCI